MDRIGWQIFATIAERWRRVVTRLEQIGRGTDIHPTNPDAVFSLDGYTQHGPIQLRVDPVLLKLPERATDIARNLYVVLEGDLAFTRPPTVGTPLVTCGFTTRVGYFRHKPDHGTLDHVFGAHYDLDVKSPSHPVCHAQMSSYIHFGQRLVDRFQLPSATDTVKGVLGTVRTPTPQMDVFSVLRQICADHLVGASPTSPVLQTFHEISADCAIADSVRSDMQARHWYG